MGGVDVPLVGRITLGHDFLHQLERAGNDGAAGFARIEKLFFVDFTSAGVMADEHHFDLVVITLEEQVQQDEKTLGDVLGGLGHGPGNVHQAKHHRLGAGVGLLDQQVVLQVEGVEKWHTIDTCAQTFDFCFYFLNITEVIGFFQLQAGEFFLGQAQFSTAAARQGDAPGMGRPQGANDVDARRVAFVADAGTHSLERVAAAEVAFDQVGQFQVLEHELEEFFLGDLEDEFVHALAGIAGLARASAATASRWPGDVLAGSEFLVAGVDDCLLATTAMVQHRLIDIAAGNADLLAVFHVSDGAATYCFFNSFFDVVTVTPQESLAVHRALVLAIETSVDHVAHKEPSGQLQVTSFQL
ncbi:hypothetical protein D3C80_1024450 [compost metagenome]